MATNDLTLDDLRDPVLTPAQQVAYYAPLYQGNNGCIVDSRVHGIGPETGGVSVLGGQDSRHAWITK